MTVRRTMNVNTERGVRSIVIVYETTNFSANKTLRSKGAEHHVAVPFLVMYCNGKVFVDERAPVWYQELAALHELICCGKQFGDLADFSDEREKRCVSVERFVLQNAGDHKYAYLSERRNMFKFIIDYGLCAVEAKAVFENTLKQLQEMTV